MKALVTGASSGMGRDMAKVLSGMGYDLIIVARRLDRLTELKNELKTNVDIICCNLSNTNECMELYHKVKDEDIDILINNAGFGLFGEFDEINLSRELDMIDTNIKALHILTKLFVQKFEKKNHGYILNVASSAAFFPGPLMTTYYATKSYVLRFSEGVYEELRRKGSNIKISVLCPGPVGTEFGSVANVKFGMNGLNSMDVSKYAIDNMLKGKLIIIPGTLMKLTKFLGRILPDKALAKLVYRIQKSKCEAR